MDFRLTEEQERIPKNIREFAEKDIEPIAVEIDENSRHPAELFRKLGDGGWMGIPLPAEYGGSGADFMTHALVVEEVSRSCSSRRAAPAGRWLDTRVIPLISVEKPLRRRGSQLIPCDVGITAGAPEPSRHSSRETEVDPIGVRGAKPIQVKPTYGLGEEEIEKMLVESIEHAEEDVTERFRA